MSLFNILWRSAAPTLPELAAYAIGALLSGGERDARKQRRAVSKKRVATRLSRAKAVAAQEKRKRRDDITRASKAKGVDPQVRATLRRLARQMDEG